MSETESPFQENGNLNFASPEMIGALAIIQAATLVINDKDPLAAYNQLAAELAMGAMVITEADRGKQSFEAELFEDAFIFAIKAMETHKATVLAKRT